MKNKSNLVVLPDNSAPKEDLELKQAQQEAGIFDRWLQEDCIEDGDALDLWLEDLDE